MKKAIMSECRDPENRSKKACCCGGHSSHDRKKDVNSRKNKRKIGRRKIRKVLERNSV